MNRYIAITSILLLAGTLTQPAAAQPPPARPTQSVENAIRQHAALPNIQSYTGQPVGNRANPSPGNKVDGIGYYMTGTKPNSFFYFIDRTRRVYANWGPIREKYAQAGYEFGSLGWPSDDEYLLPAGDEIGYPNSQADFNNKTKKNVYISYQNFDNGIMYYLYDKTTRQYTVLTQLKNPNLNPSRPH